MRDNQIISDQSLKVVAAEEVARVTMHLPESPNTTRAHSTYHRHNSSNQQYRISLWNLSLKIRSKAPPKYTYHRPSKIVLDKLVHGVRTNEVRQEFTLHQQIFVVNNSPINTLRRWKVCQLVMIPSSATPRMKLRILQFKLNLCGYQKALKIMNRT